LVSALHLVPARLDAIVIGTVTSYG
jgi:hypothetical protein